MKNITIYTDGACSGNPGAGGYGVVLIYSEKRKELSNGYRLTTNNRMEVLAVIRGLESLKEPCEVTLYSDSKYVTDAINKKWLDKWMKNSWRKSDKSPVLNVDLWKKLNTLLGVHTVNFNWVKGHAENVENERCDILATTAIKLQELLVDEEYEKQK